MIFLVFVEPNHLLLIGQAEGLRDKVETLRAEFLAKLHRACEYVFVGQQLDIWVAVAQLFFARVDPLENFLVRQIWMHPSERCLSLASFTPVRLLPYEFLEKWSDMVCFLSANAESLASWLLLLSLLLILGRHFDFLLKVGVSLVSGSLHLGVSGVLILDNFYHGLLF